MPGENDMFGIGRRSRELSKLSVAELEQAYVESVETEEATEHIGRKKRLARHRVNVVEVLRARGKARAALERLAKHSNTHVSANATGALDRLDKPARESVPNRRCGHRSYGSAIIHRRRH
jgi:hypothetical protein